jgi:hypothetical protein
VLAEDYSVLSGHRDQTVARTDIDRTAGQAYTSIVGSRWTDMNGRALDPQNRATNFAERV